MQLVYGATMCGASLERRPFEKYYFMNTKKSLAL